MMWRPRGVPLRTRSPARTGGGFVDATRGHRCPVCGATQWCGIARDGLTVLCKHDATGIERTTSDGVTFYVHHVDGGPPPPANSFAPPRGVARAPVEVLHRGYGIVLARLDLDAHDRDALTRRGLDGARVEANGYRTLRVQGRAALARAVVEAIGEHLAPSIPGMVWRVDDNDPRRGWWSFAGSPGLVIPVRDLEGRVVALKVRRRDPIEDGGARYLYVTSARHGGSSAMNAVHVPELARELRADAAWLVITEGELKADVATALLKAPVVSVPGVGSWRAGVDLAVAWGAPAVAVAFDMDAATNRTVAAAQRDITRALRTAGMRADVWTWDARWKGLDDYLSRDLDGRARTGATDDHAR